MRLITSGFELYVAANVNYGINAVYTDGNTVGTIISVANQHQYSTTTNANNVRSGTYSMRINAANAASLNVWWDGCGWQPGVAVANSNTIYTRTAIRFEPGSTGSANINVMALGNSTTIASHYIQTRIDTANGIYLANAANTGAVDLTTKKTLLANTWYVVEMMANTTDCELRIDGVTQPRTANAWGNAIISGTRAFWVGKCGAAAGGATANAGIYFDDVGLNISLANATLDPAGTQDRFCGLGKVVFLKPVSDVSNGAWFAGVSANASSNTNLWQGCSTIPPTGKPVPGTVTSQIATGNVANTAEAECRLNLTDWTTAGIGSNSKVELVRPLILGCEVTSTGAAKSQFIALWKDPQVNTAYTGNLFTTTQVTLNLQSWQWMVAPYIYYSNSSPTMNRSNNPVISITRSGDTAGRSSGVGLAGAYIEYENVTRQVIETT